MRARALSHLFYKYGHIVSDIIVSNAFYYIVLSSTIKFISFIIKKENWKNFGHTYYFISRMNYRFHKSFFLHCWQRPFLGVFIDLDFIWVCETRKKKPVNFQASPSNAWATMHISFDLFADNNSTDYEWQFTQKIHCLQKCTASSLPWMSDMSNSKGFLFDRDHVFLWLAKGTSS